MCVCVCGFIIIIIFNGQQLWHMPTISIQTTKTAIASTWCTCNTMGKHKNISIYSQWIRIFNSSWLYIQLSRNCQAAWHYINALKSIIARFWIPKIIVLSDNGPQFSSAQFLSFAMFCNFQSQTSSPEWSQSNDRAKYAVHIAKRLIKKSAKTRYIFTLLPYWATPLECGKSSADLFFGLHLWNTMPNVHLLENTKPKERK